MSNRKVFALVSAAGLGLVAFGCEEKKAPAPVVPAKPAAPAATTPPPAPAVPAATTPAPAPK